MSDPQIERKNFIFNLAEGALYTSAGSLTSAQTVLPALVVQLGGSDIAVGALSVIFWVGLFLPQVFAARYVQTLAWKKPWAIKFGIAHRSTVLLMAVSLLAFGGRNNDVALALFFLFYICCQILLGITTPGWFDMFAKMIPTRKRGRLVGLRSSLGGVGAFCSGLILTWLLAHASFPLNYGIAFLLAFVLQVASVIVQSNVVEEEPSPVVPRQPLLSFLRELPAVVRANRPFRAFLTATTIQIVATMPVGFYTVYALSRFQVDASFVGEFTLAMVAVQVVSSLVVGMLADRFGNKVSLTIAATALLAANVCALAAPSVGWFFAVYVFLGVNLGTELLARYNIAVEYAPVEQRATYIGLMNTVIAPFYGVGMIGGTIAGMFGYSSVFWIGVLASVVGTVMTVVRVQDPRRFNAGMAPA